MKTATIDDGGINIIAHDQDWDIIGTKSTYCNPAALHQLILDVESMGYTIDWDCSEVAQPEPIK